MADGSVQMSTKGGSASGGSYEGAIYLGVLQRLLSREARSGLRPAGRVFARNYGGEGRGGTRIARWAGFYRQEGGLNLPGIQGTWNLYFEIYLTSCQLYIILLLLQ